MSLLCARDSGWVGGWVGGGVGRTTIANIASFRHAGEPRAEARGTRGGEGGEVGG